MKRVFKKQFIARAFLIVLAVASCRSSFAAVDFAKDVQPVFARHCYECHGAEKQKGKLRLDNREAALKGGSSGTTIIPKNADKSELFRRISLPKGHEDIMPSRGEPLSAVEIGFIRDWINEGALWPENVVAAKHWSYEKPVRRSLPSVKNRSWVRNPVDAFVLSRLEKENLRPSLEADRSKLLRRVYLDLIGLPPSPDELEKFLADTSPEAYEKVVDRLLASPQYGERWARPWLDLARYADSLGYQRDNLWDLWPYRDWVINAMNRDLPFDQFTIEQIAGDMLPDATMEQKIATGFNRCVPTNVEAGSDQEETRVTQLFDRVNTVGSVWLGSTLECAQCHNHKYDPFTQKEYYQLMAFFNNTPKETDFLSPKAKASLDFKGPYLTLPDTETEAKRAAIKEKIDKVAEQIRGRSETLLTEQAKWEQEARASTTGENQLHVLKISDFDAESGSAYQSLEDDSILLIKNDNDATPVRDTYTVIVSTRLTNITGFKLEALTDPSLPGGGPGRAGEKNPNFVLNHFSVAVAQPAGGEFKPVKLKNAVASYSQQNFPVAGAIDDSSKSGWAIRPEFFKNHWATFETTSPVGFANGSELRFVLEQNNGSSRIMGRFRLVAMTGKSKKDTLPVDIAGIVRLSDSERSAEQQKRLKDHFLSLDAQLEKLKSERAKLESELKKTQMPQTLVMTEMAKPRMSSVFVRGNFLERGEPVQPGVPAVLHSQPEGPANRLALARWLVDTNNPLVARVTVNRWWAEFFGRGLVATPEDFGIKGEVPTHPELLDWLAVEFMEKGWSMKKMHRLIVTSATYRQASNVTPELFRRDDQNKLYARGARFRMDAEMIRDNALAAAGLLSLKQAGPPIRPYQPPGIWENKVGGDDISYETSEGEDQYRRGVYVVTKRTSPYPSFINFDATARNACVIKRSRSNTPLQALTLLNDPVYVEAAMALAKRVLDEQAAESFEGKLSHAFALCLSRKPSAKEINVLKKLYDEQLQVGQGDPAAVKKFIGDFSFNQNVSLPEFAAWQAVAWALLNLDEMITKS